MKKKLFKGVVLFASLSITLTSCKKDVSPKSKSIDELTANVVDISSDKRMLIFNSSSSYENIISNNSETFQKDFINKISKMDFMTYAEKNQVEKSDIDLIDDSYFSNILNKDWIVQIGDYLYRVNPIKEKVFVLPSSHINEYNDLVNENKSNKNIRQFSTGDYVIQLAESGDAGEKGLFCGEDGCGNAKTYTDQVSIPTVGADLSPATYNFQGNAEYLRLGIYFCLKAEANSNSSNIRIYVNFENAWDKVKCGNTDAATSQPWYQNNSTYSRQQIYRKYYSIQPLNGMHMKMRVRCEVPTSGSSYNTYFTYWTEISANSPY